MALTYNGVTPSAITYNGNNVNEVVYNGVVVWTSQFNILDNGVINSDITELQETYHTTTTSYTKVDNYYRVQGKSWSGANFGTTISRLQTLNTNNFNTITISFVNPYSGNDGYGQGYVAIVPKGSDYPKFKSYHQTNIINSYKGLYFSGYSSDTQTGTYDIDISSLSGDYDIIIAIGGYNAQTHYVDVNSITAH